MASVRTDSSTELPQSEFDDARSAPNAVTSVEGVRQGSETTTVALQVKKRAKNHRHSVTDSFAPSVRDDELSLRSFSSESQLEQQSVSPKKSRKRRHSVTGPESPENVDAVPEAPLQPVLTSRKHVCEADESTPPSAKSIVLHPEKKPEQPWQHVLQSNLANNSTSILQSLIKMSLVHLTPLSENALFMTVNKHKTTQMEQLFSTLHDETTKAALKNHSLYKSFWTCKQADCADPSVLAEASPDQLSVLKTLISYVPRVVVRRFAKNPGQPIRAPEVESYLSCVLFADISGFTPLTESLAAMGAEGVERVTAHLNDYFGKMIKIISTHGGDIVKFAGDALLVVWPTDSQEGLFVNSMLSLQCAIALQTKLGTYTVGETTLRLHIGMGAGSIAGIHVGGVQGRLEFFVAGDPLRQVAECEAAAQPGQIFISPELQEIVSKHAIGEFVNNHFRLDSISAAIALPAIKEPPPLAILETRLRPYVPAAVLSHLDTHEYLAELRTVSVLFINLNIKYENNEDSPRTIQLCVAAMQAILSRLEGTVRQFLVDDKGSVLIAAFGVPPMSHEDDAVRAVEAAMEIQKILIKLNIEPCIGVTTGRAFCGAVGSEHRREYAMVGDIVNLAARLMVAAHTRGGILCDEATTLAARSSIMFEDLDPITVKGKRHPVAIRVPKSRALLNSNQLQTISPILSPEHRGNSLIGRKTVLALLEYKLQQLTAKIQETGHVFVVEGEAGSGKSKLIEQIPVLAAPGSDVFCSMSDVSAGTQTFYGSWSFIFNAVLELSTVTDEKDLLDHLAKMLQRIPKTLPLPDLQGLIPDWVSLAPLLNSILPLGVPENQITARLPDQSRAEALQILLIRLLQTLVAPGSIIILEDAHHFDSNSWTLTLAVAQQLRGVMIVVTLRPLKPPLPFAYQQIVHCQNAHSAILAPLSSEDSIALANQILGVQKMPKLLADQIAAKGQGIPFIIEQLASSLRESGDIEIVDGEVKVKPGAQIQLPSSVRQLITAKLDKLTASQKSVLKVASVIGKSFVVSLLLQLLANMTQAELQADLRALQKAGFIMLEQSDEHGVSDPHNSRPPEPTMHLAEAEPSSSLDNESIKASPNGKRKRRQGQQHADSELRAENPPLPVPESSNSSTMESNFMQSSALDAQKQLGLESSSLSPQLQLPPNKPGPHLAGHPKVSPLRMKKMRGSVSRSTPPSKIPPPAEKTGSISISSARVGEAAATSTTAYPIPMNPSFAGFKLELPAPRLSPRSPETPPDSARRRPISRKFSMSGTLRGSLRKALDPASEGSPRDKLSSPRPPSPSSSEHDFLLTEYSFKNETSLEVVYNMMLFGQRRQLHASIAQWYESTYANNLSIYAPIIAHHLKLSEQNLDRAAKYYSQAGEQALRNFSNGEAVNFFLDALQLRKKLKKLRSKSAHISSTRKGMSGSDDDELFLALHLKRKLGQAYYNLGNFAAATKHLLSAVKTFKLSPATTEKLPSIADPKLLKDFGALMACDAHVKREVVLALLTMAKCYYYSCNRKAATFCNVFALTLAEKSNFWAEQAEAYAQSIVTAGLQGQEHQAKRYLELGKNLAQDKLDLYSSVLQMEGAYFLGKGDWSSSETALRECIDACQRTGDRRRFEESNVFLSLNHFLRGQFRKSLAVSASALDSARLRGDVQCQILALSSQVCCHLTLGNIAKAGAKLDQIRVAINRDFAERSSDLRPLGVDKKWKDEVAHKQSDSTGDIASDVNYYALMALLSLCKNEITEAFHAVVEASSILSDRNLEPTAFFTFPAYMHMQAIPEVYLRILLRPKAWSSVSMTKKKLLKRFHLGLAPLQGFAAVFPFAAPRYLLLEGLGCLISGNHAEALRLWKDGFSKATDLRMRTEAATIQKHMSAPPDQLSESELFLSPSKDAALEKPRRKAARRRSTELADRLDEPDARSSRSKKKPTELQKSRSFVEPTKRHRSEPRPGEI